MQKWYVIVTQNVDTLLAIFLREDVQSINKTLNVLRCGLYSRSAEVVNVCTRLFSRLFILLNERRENAKAAELRHYIWDWLTIK